MQKFASSTYQHIAPLNVTTCTRSGPASLPLDACEFYHLGPLFGFARHKFCKLLRCAAHNGGANVIICLLDRPLATAAFISRFSRATISFGVCFGAPRPAHPIAS